MIKVKTLVWLLPNCRPAVMTIQIVSVTHELIFWLAQGNAQSRFQGWRRMRFIQVQIRKMRAMVALVIRWSIPFCPPVLHARTATLQSNLLLLLWSVVQISLPFYFIFSAGLHGRNTVRCSIFLRESPYSWLTSWELTFFRRRFPSPIPSDIMVPSWAFSDISVGLSLKFGDILPSNMLGHLQSF